MGKTKQCNTKPTQGGSTINTGDKVTLESLDGTIVTGTIVKIGKDNIVLDKTNVYNYCVFISEENIKKLTVPIK